MSSVQATVKFGLGRRCNAIHRSRYLLDLESSGSNKILVAWRSLQERGKSSCLVDEA